MSRAAPVSPRATAPCSAPALRLLTQLLGAAMLAALLLVLTAGRASAAEPWPAIPLPPKAEAQWIAQSMRVNGVPTRVLQFQSRASRTEVADYYRAYWSGGYERRPSVHSRGDATFVGQRHGPYVMTVKVEDADRGEGSQGFISIARLLGTRVVRDPGELPLLDGAHVLSVVDSDDPGKHARNVTVVTPQPPATVAHFYEDSFGNSGWRQIQGTDAPARAGVPAAHFLVFARAGTELQLSIVATPKAGGTIVVANRVTKDTGPDGD